MKIQALDDEGNPFVEINISDNVTNDMEEVYETFAKYQMEWLQLKKIWEVIEDMVKSDMTNNKKNKKVIKDEEYTYTIELTNFYGIKDGNVKKALALAPEIGSMQIDKQKFRELLKEKTEISKQVGKLKELAYQKLDTTRSQNE